MSTTKIAKEIGLIDIAAGFRQDCSKLISQFVLKKKFNYEGFSDAWNKLKFSLTLRSRSSHMESYEFYEEALNISKDFLRAERRIEEKIGGIYLLYSIFFKIDIKGPKIRMSSTDWKFLIKFKAELISRKCYEALFILKKLVDNNAFIHCYPGSERGLESYFIIHEFMKEDLKIEETSNHDKAEFLDMINDISRESQDYFQLKKQLNVSIVNKNIPNYFNEENLNEMLDEIQNLDNRLDEPEKIFVKEENIKKNGLEYSEEQSNDESDQNEESNSSESEYNPSISDDDLDE